MLINSVKVETRISTLAIKRKHDHVLLRHPLIYWHVLNYDK